jgi:UrcA family protein
LVIRRIGDKAMRIASLTVAAMLAIGPNAHAQDSHFNQVSIDASRYDLSKPGDAKALVSRIESAALNLCGGPPGAYFWDTMATPCYQDAVRRAVESAHNSMLTLAYEQRHGGEARPTGAAVAAR